MQVMLDPLLDLLDGFRLAAPAVDLRPAGDAGLHAMTPEIVADRVLVEQAAGFRRRCMGARPDDGHVSGQHVEELRQLVEAGPAQEGAQPRYPRIVAPGQ